MIFLIDAIKVKKDGPDFPPHVLIHQAVAGQASSPQAVQINLLKSYEGGLTLPWVRISSSS